MVSGYACKRLQILRTQIGARGVHAERTSAVESPHIGGKGSTLHWFLNVKKKAPGFREPKPVSHKTGTGFRVWAWDCGRITVKRHQPNEPMVLL